MTRRPDVPPNPDDYMPIIDGIPRLFERVDEGRYRMALESLGLSFEVDRLRIERHQWHAELIVRCAIAGARTHNGAMSIADFNLSSLTSRKQHAGYLQSRLRANDIPMIDLLEELCQRVLDAERTGRPSESLADPMDSESDQATVETVEITRFPLLLQLPTILFGPGGSAKSLFALYLAGYLRDRALRVAYIDWELSKREHQRRLWRLFPSPPDVRYYRASLPLVQEIDAIRRMVRDEAIDFAIFDSVAFACEGAPETSEAALGYFGAVRRLGEIGTLHLAHQTKDEAGDKMPFGSVFWFNAGRAVWNIKPSQGNAPGMHTIGLFCRKHLDGLQPARGYEFRFSPDRIFIAPNEVADSPDLATHMTTRERIAAALRAGPLTVDQLVEETNCDRETLRRTINRFVKKSQWFTRLPDGRIAPLAWESNA